MALLRRLFVIVIGYVLAVIVATFGMTGTDIFQNFSAGPWYAIDWRGISAILTTYGMLIATYAFLPVAIAIAIAEWRTIRSLAAHLLAGTVAGIVATGTLGRISPALLNPLGIPPQGLSGLVPIILASIAAASVYWLIAGREAGNWRKNSGKSIEKI
jgi:hypothetical protein